MSIIEKNLKLYLNNNFNVMLSGRHGIGKTEIIKSLFQEKFGDNWAYFSASTMDVWVDFIGVPKPIKRADGTEVLRLIRPERFADDNIEALIFDEYNRSDSKVQNAVMELIQFKSINGIKFKNLKVIWIAVNPFDEEGTYDVKDLDPAQLDRFPIKITMPYKVDKKYFNNKHGAISKPFTDWWSTLTEENKFKVSPRLLDNAIDIYQCGGDLRDVLPKETNINDLLNGINSVSIDDEWLGISKKTKEEKLLFFMNLGNVTKFKSKIIDEFSEYINYIPEDYIMNIINTKEIDFLEKMLKIVDDIPESIIKEVENDYKKDFKDVLKEGLGLSFNLDFNGKNVVITGKFLKNYRGGNSQSEIEDLLNRIGAKIQKAVNSKTDYVLQADTNIQSAKSKAAKNRNIPVISDEEFHKVYGNY